MSTWISSKTRKMNGVYKDWHTTQAKNVQRLREAEQKGRLDFVLYGDSITSYHYGYTISQRNPGSNAIWKKHLGNLNSVPLAIPGDQIGQVIWRLQKGNEKPKEDPRVVGFLIGANDVIRFGEDKTQPRVPPSAERMKHLLEWVKKNMPTSAVIVCGLTPMTNPEMLTARSELTADYKSLVATYAGKGMRIKYVDCSSSISNADGTPKGTGYLADHVHPTAKGHDIILKCLRTAIDSMLTTTTTGTTTNATDTSTTILSSGSRTLYITMAVMCVCCFFTSSLLALV